MSDIRKKKASVVRSSKALGRALGLSAADSALMQFRTELGIAVAKAIKDSALTHADIAKRVGTSRTRVTGIANQGLSGVSSDLMVKVLAAVGYAVNPKLRALKKTEIVKRAHARVMSTHAAVFRKLAK